MPDPPSLVSPKRVPRGRSFDGKVGRAHHVGHRFVEADEEEGAGVGDSVKHGPSPVPLVCGAEQDLVDVYSVGLGEAARPASGVPPTSGTPRASSCLA